MFRFIPCYFSLHIERDSCSAPCPKKCRLKRVFRKNRTSFGSCFVKINYSGKFLKFPRFRQCRCHDSDIIVINPSELAERQGIRAASGFNSVSRAIIKQDEPILVPCKAALRRHFVQFIAADSSKRTPDIIAVRRFNIKVFPINYLTLRMIGKDKPKLVIGGEIKHGAALRRGKRLSADKIARCGRNPALSIFRFLCRIQPAG